MSINVTVHGNPVSVKHGKMVMGDIECMKKDEIHKRRKIRLEQVRQQSKEIACKLRNRIAAEKNKKLSQLEQSKAAELKRWQAEKRAALQDQYQECLDEIGKSQSDAAEQPDAIKVLQETKNLNDQAAGVRGRNAARKLREIQEEKKKKITPRYSNYKSPKKNNIQVKRKTVEIISDPETITEEDGSFSASESEIDGHVGLYPPLPVVYSSSTSHIIRKKKTVKKKQHSDASDASTKSNERRLARTTDSSADKNSDNVKTSNNERLKIPEIPNLPECNAPCNSDRSDRLSSTNINNKSGNVIDVTNIELLTIVNKNANSRSSQENMSQANSNPMFTSVSNKIKTRNLNLCRGPLRSIPEEMSCSIHDNPVRLIDNAPIPSDIPLHDQIETSVPYHQNNVVIESSDVNHEQSCTCCKHRVDLQADAHCKAVCNAQSSVRPHSYITEQYDTVKSNIVLGDSNARRTEKNIKKPPSFKTKHNSNKILGRAKLLKSSPTKQSLSSKRSSNPSINPPTASTSRVHFYDYGNRFHKEYDPPGNLVEKSNSREDEMLAHEMAINERTEVSKVVLDQIKNQKAVDEISKLRGQQALNKLQVNRDYENLLGRLGPLARQERLARRYPDLIHYDDARLSTRNSKFQTNMDNAFENILYGNDKESIPQKIITIKPQQSQARKLLGKENSEPLIVKDGEPISKLNVAYWDAPSNRVLSNNNKYRGLQETPTHDLSSESSASSIVVGHIDETSPAKKQDNVVFKSKIEQETLHKLLERINVQRQMLLAVDKANLPENSRLGEVLQSVEDSFNGAKKTTDKTDGNNGVKVVKNISTESLSSSDIPTSSGDTDNERLNINRKNKVSDMDGKEKFLDDKFENERRRLDRREKKLHKKELKLEKRIKKHKNRESDLKAGKSLGAEARKDQIIDKNKSTIQSKTSSQRHKDDVDALPFDKTAVEDRGRIRIEEERSGSTGIPPPITPTVIAAEKPIFTNNVPSDQSVTQSSIASSNSVVTTTSSGVEIHIKIQDKTGHKGLRSPRKISLQTKGNVTKKNRKNTVRIHHSGAQIFHQDSSASTSYMSPPQEITQMRDLLRQMSREKTIYNPTNQQTTNIDLSKFQQIKRQTNVPIIHTGYNSNPSGAELNSKSNSTSKNQLAKYINKLLSMSRDSIDRLGVSSSEVSTPGESVINMSTNQIGQQLGNELQATESPGDDRVEKLRKFITENYSFIDSIETSLKQDVSKNESVVPSRTTEQIIKVPLDNEKNHNLEVSTTKGKTLKSGTAIKKTSMPATEVKSTTESAVKSPKNVISNIKDTISNTRQTNVNLDKPDASDETINDLELSTIPHREKENKGTSTIGPDPILFENEITKKYSELAENCHQRIASLADLIHKVRKEKMRLVEGSFSSKSTGEPNSTEYMDLPNVNSQNTSEADVSNEISYKSPRPLPTIGQFEDISEENIILPVPAALNPLETVKISESHKPSSSVATVSGAHITRAHQKGASFVPMLGDIPKPKAQDFKYKETVVQHDDEKIRLQQIDNLKSHLLSSSQSSELFQPKMHLAEGSSRSRSSDVFEREINNLQNDMTDLHSQLDGIEYCMGDLQEYMGGLGNNIAGFKQHKSRPPVALRRNSYVNNMNAVDKSTPHELSTIVEVDTPAASRVLEQSVGSDEDRTTNAIPKDKLTPAKLASISITNTSIGGQDQTTTKKQKQHESNDDHNKAAISSAENQQRLNKPPQELGTSERNKTSFIDELVTKLPSDLTLDSSSTEFQLQPFPTFQEYQRRVQQTGQKSIDETIHFSYSGITKNLENVSSPNNASDNTLPDVIGELLRRNILQAPFDNRTVTDESNNRPSSTISNNVTPSKKIMNVPKSPRKHRSPSKKTGNDQHIEQLDNDSENMYRTLSSGFGLLSDTSTETMSSISSPEFEIALKKLGLNWAVSTLRKTHEALALSSTSSYDEKSSDGRSSKVLPQKGSVKKANEGIMKTLSKELSDIPTPKSLLQVETSSIESEYSVTMTNENSLDESHKKSERNYAKLDLKQFLARQISKGSSSDYSSNSVETSHNNKELTFKSLLAGVRDESTVGDSNENSNIGELQRTQSRTNLRTSTPVQEVKTLSKSSKSSSPSNTDNLFSGESHLSYVRNISEAKQSKSSNDDSISLTVPQINLNIENTLKKIQQKNKD